MTLLGLTTTYRTSEELLLYRLKNNEKGRDNEKQGDGSNEHTTDSAHTKRTVSVGTDTCRQGHWQQTEYHGHWKSSRQDVDARQQHQGLPRQYPFPVGGVLTHIL